jgi:hypothetical protein
MICPTSTVLGSGSARVTTRSPTSIAGAIDPLVTVQEWPPTKSGTPAARTATARMATMRTPPSAAK